MNIVKEIRQFIIGGGEGITGVVSARWSGVAVSRKRE
jgi:hypothetical protein